MSISIYTPSVVFPNWGGRGRGYLWSDLDFELREEEEESLTGRSLHPVSREKC